MSEYEKSLKVTTSEIVSLFDRAISNVREEMRDNPYITEALRVLQVKGYRSAIGCVWNAVVDDLRNKIIFRSIDLFNKSITLRRQVKTYEDFQDYVNDDELIEVLIKLVLLAGKQIKFYDMQRKLDIFLMDILKVAIHQLLKYSQCWMIVLVMS
ncbi:hypothetical protein [Treponema denticola]|uniref:hypothetical protein n=1 Tax=Treponema denticola TaxID=158 RepID=UPI002107A542|nr:hypothetical protein [Treponema denticola]